jgi:hypothetical protein
MPFRKHAALLGLVPIAVVGARVLVGSPRVYVVGLFLGWLCFPLGFFAAGAATRRRGPWDFRSPPGLSSWGAWLDSGGSWRGPFVGRLGRSCIDRNTDSLSAGLWRRSGGSGRLLSGGPHESPTD